jgi:hypothetical protein
MPLRTSVSAYTVPSSAVSRRNGLSAGLLKIKGIAKIWLPGVARR